MPSDANARSLVSISSVVCKSSREVFLASLLRCYSLRQSMALSCSCLYVNDTTVDLWMCHNNGRCDRGSRCKRAVG